MTNQAMCEDTQAAKANRKRVEADYGREFYVRQAHAVAQWQFGERPPASVILGELPCVGKYIRLDRDD